VINLPDITQLVGTLAWPLVVLILLIGVATTKTGQRLVTGLAGRIKGVSALGFSLELTTEAATENKDSIETAFENYRSKIRREFDRQVSTHSLDEQLRKLAKDYVWPALSEEVKKDCRCTIHVPDILFDQTLYQLLDYYPTGGGRGRVFSARYGIVGASYRSETDQYRADVPTAQDKLIVEWGMTSQEAAAAGQGRQSFACFVLRQSEHKPTLGILYLDTKVKNAFGTSDVANIAPRVHEGLTTTGIDTTLATIELEMRSRGPAVKVLA
jgi:hypothetical protein